MWVLNSAIWGRKMHQCQLSDKTENFCHFYDLQIIRRKYYWVEIMVDAV